MTAHVVPVRVNLTVYGLLILLTITTFGADYVDMGAWNLAAAISIAVVKALLVGLYFMHLRYGGHLVWVFSLAGVCWLMILIALTLGDVMTRGWVFVPKGWE